MNVDRPRAAVVYNEPVLPPDHPDAVSEAEVVEVAQFVVDALGARGFDARPLSAAPPVTSFLDRLVEARPDVVFNLLEGFGGRSNGETHLTSLFELLRIPYTGSPPRALGLCIVKSSTKALLRGWGLRTADWRVVGPDGPVPAWTGDWPVIVKPDAEDASLGIHQSSVVETQEDVADRVDRLRREYGGPVLIESYLPGTEFNVGLLALPEVEALPLSQVIYDSTTGLRPVLTYAAKWDPSSVEDRGSVIVCPAEVGADLAVAVASAAVRAFQVTGCRDYARVDVRLDREGRPVILEVNSNPDVSLDAGLARAVRASGRDHAATIAAIARQALERRDAR